MSSSYPNIPDELLDDIFETSNFRPDNRGSLTNLDVFSNNSFNFLDPRVDQRQQPHFSPNCDSLSSQNTQGPSNQITASSSTSFLYSNSRPISSTESPYSVSDIGSVTPQETTNQSTGQPGQEDLSTANDSEEKKKRNTQASARFRYKRRMKELELEERFNEINNYIAGLEVQIKTLEMENACLKKIILTDRSGDGNSTGGRLSNYELLKSLKEQSSGTFTITKF